MHDARFSDYITVTIVLLGSSVFCRADRKEKKKINMLQSADFSFWCWEVENGVVYIFADNFCFYCMKGQAIMKRKLSPE